MNRKHLVQAVLFLAVFFMTGEVLAATYRSELRKVTERDRIYNFDNFDARLIWHATFFSDDFRQAYIKKHAKINHLNDEDAEVFAAKQNWRQENNWDFFIGVYAQSDYKKITSGKDSFWNIYLITESGEKIAPSSVEPIPISPYERMMFSYLNRWAKGYRISFPKIELGKKFQLFLYSVVGDSTLKWKLK
jgi:hypothetical protein